MNKSFILFLIFLASALTQTAEAFRVKTLYQSQVPVQTQSDTDKSTAILTAFDKVLIKVSGDSTINNNEKIKMRKKSAESLIEEYSYTTASPASKQPPYLLTVRFDAEAIDQLLREANASIWGQNRPLILLWIDSELPGLLPEIINNDAVNPISQLFKQNAELRGLPVLFPLMDVTDINHVSINDIATLTAPNLINAAKRYKSDTILIGRIQLDNTGYKTEWKLINAKGEWRWSITDHNLEYIVQTIIDHTAQLIATHYATVTTPTIQKNVNLRIIGINQQTDFAILLHYLTQLTPVANVNITKISGDEMTLAVSLRSSDNDFIKTLSAGNKLTPLSINDGGPQLAYQWNT